MASRLLTLNTKSNLTGFETGTSEVADGALLAHYRGHLTLPKGATPNDHRAAKTRFMDNLRNARKKLGCVLELHCNLHLISPTEGHYDYVLYTDLDEPDVRRVIRSAWQGRWDDPTYRYALVPVAESHLSAATAYHAKANNLPAGEDRLLPVSKGQPGYMEATWHTSGFWGDSSLDREWKRL